MQEDKDSSGECCGNSSSGAVAAQRGFDYQLDVSVLAALNLLLISNGAESITLEAASEEDIEAELAPYEPSCVVPSANVSGGQRLIIQVKLHNGNPWSIADFTRLLNHGKRRKPARTYLEDERVRYLLVTSADCSGVARKLVVNGFLECPDPADFPSSLRRTLRHAPEGRVAIWGQLSEHWLELELQHTFSLLKIPQNKHVECLRTLRDEAKRRMLGTYGGAWLRKDLQTNIERYNGYWGASGDLEKFVPPSNFNQLMDVLERKSGVVITGRSGIGKTFAALALCELARKSEPGLNILSIDSLSSPSTIRLLPKSGLTLIYVEDPWGQYSLRPGADAWTTQLPTLLRAAKPGLRYVITSRSDMLMSADALAALMPWSVELDADNYVGGELERIYENNMQLLQPQMQLKALEFQPRVLERLDTPLELDLYFSGLMQGPEPGEVDPAFLNRLLLQSHREAVKDVVIQYLASIDNVTAPAQIWALLAARGLFDRSQLASVQRRLRQLDHRLAGKLEKAIDRLIGTRHLKQPSVFISFAHPSVRAGFEEFIKSNWSESEFVFEQLIAALTSLPVDLSAWGIETAGRVVAEVKELAANVSQRQHGLQVDESSQATLDTWLEQALLDEEADFPALMRLASKVGSSASVPCELARWFVQGFRRGGDYFAEKWAPLQFDDAWYERVYADSRTALIVSRFIRIQLPGDDGDYDDDFPVQLSRLAIGLEAAFIDAARSIIGEGHLPVASMIAREAVRDLDAYLDIVNASLDYIHTTRPADKVEKPIKFRIADGELNTAEEDYYEDYQDDSGWTSATLVEAYVVARRADGAWEDLASHPRASELASIWAQCTRDASVAPSEAEVLAVFVATELAGSQDTAWELASKYWFHSLTGKLIVQILSFADDEMLRWAAVRCACKVASVALNTCFRYLSSDSPLFVRLIVDIHDAMEFEDHTELRHVLGAESPVVLEIFDALSKKHSESDNFCTEAKDLLANAISQACAYVVAAVAPILIKHGVRPHAIVRQWMQAAVYPEDAKYAVSVAIELGNVDGVREALEHVRASARELALEHLAATMEVPFPPTLLTLADDPGRRVRLALLRALTDKPHPDHFTVLMKLTGDRWDNSSPRYNESPSYPIACDAVIAMAAYPGLPNEMGNQLIRLAIETDDLTLRNLSLQLAARNCSAQIQAEIWSMVQSESHLDFRVGAADAIAIAPRLDARVLEKVLEQSLNGHPASLAISLVRLICLHLEVVEVLRRLEQLSQQPSQRALLVVGIAFLRQRDRGAAEQVCRLLGEDHLVCSLVKEPGKKLSRRVLDDLGDVRIRRAILTRMSELFRRT